MTVFFEPERASVEASAMTAFARAWGAETGRDFSDALALHRASIADAAGFWAAFARFAGLRLSGERTPTIEISDPAAAVERAVFFPRAELSYAAHLLEPVRDAAPESLAVIAVDESGARVELTRAALADSVRRVAGAMRARGVRAGDRVVGLCRNTANTLIAYIATIALGATWSSAAPDMGTELLLARAGQVDPKVLFVDVQYPYQGVPRDNHARLEGIVGSLPSLERVVIFDDASASAALQITRPVERFADWLAHEPLTGELERFPFNQPALILFSSGTTGLPKCIVHGAGGTLLEHLKELLLHCDLGPEDRVLYHTTTGWMMYNWLVSALATGATVVLYDGSVTHPEPDALFRRVAELGVTVFGTSPAYLGYLKDAAVSPREGLDLSRLRLLLSTGSVLSELHYDFVSEHIGRVPIHSISGGTDIVGCFVMGSPNLPVWRGESSCVSLGLDVRVAVETAHGTVLHGPPESGSVVGELVCASPFPSRPVGLFNDPDGARFHEAYFSQHPGIWTHGDTLELTSRGSARVLGRSDGILNVRGIRIGPGEIYRVLEAFPEIRAACAVEQLAPGEVGGSRLLLLVAMKERGSFGRPLMLKVKKELSTKASAAHVPAAIVEVSDVPRTHNNKLSERAARDAANGLPVKNRSAIRNPECLDEIAAHPDVVAARGAS